MSAYYVQLMRYVKAAHVLAEAVRKNAVKGGPIEEKTVEALNNYIVTYNDIQDLVESLDTANNTLN